MKNERAERELQRVRELANEYTKKGYSVVYPRVQSDLPDFLQKENYMPDLLATSAEEKLVIEVKSAETVRNDKKMSRVSEVTNRRPGWHFVFVLTNSKQELTVETNSKSGLWNELLSKSRHPALELPELREAAFVLAWAALEGAVREALAAVSTKRSNDFVGKSPLSQMRDAVILGLIDRTDLSDLEAFFKMRNNIVHSIGGARPSFEEVRRLQSLVDEVARIVQASNK